MRPILALAGLAQLCAAGFLLWTLVRGGEGRVKRAAYMTAVVSFATAGIFISELLRAR